MFPCSSLLFRVYCVYKKHSYNERVGMDSLTDGWFAIAMRALVVLVRFGPQEICSSGTIANDIHSHVTFLRRVLARLVKADLVEAYEGRSGGYRLARSAEKITLADVYRAVQTLEQEKTQNTGTTGCIPSSSMSASLDGILSEIRKRAEMQLLEALTTYTLADVANRTAGSKR